MLFMGGGDNENNFEWKIMKNLFVNASAFERLLRYCDIRREITYKKI